MEKTATGTGTCPAAAHLAAAARTAAATASRFYPIMGKNVSIQAIVEGNLLAQIELDPIPEYGVHL